MTTGDADERRADRAASLLEREYEYVSALIPFYRRVELGALVATAVLVTSALTTVAVLEAADPPKSAAAGVLLTTAACVPPFLLLLQFVAVVRLRRAAFYIRDRLRPLARELTGDERILGWEVSREVDMTLTGKGRLHGVILSVPLLPPLAAALGLASAGIAKGPSLLTWLVGVAACVASISIAGLVLSQNLVTVASPHAEPVDPPS
jgi:hypothetical protein